jgi:hypothetical protein
MPYQAGFKGCEGKKYRGGKVKSQKSTTKTQKNGCLVKTKHN